MPAPATQLVTDPGTGAFVLESYDAGVLKAVNEDHGWARAPAWAHPAVATRCEYAALALREYADIDTLCRLADRISEYEASTALAGEAKYPHPAELELMPFQRAGIHYALSRKHAVIGDEMGLGKTVQAIVMANEMQAERVLVVCPASVRLQWQSMVRVWSTLRRVSTYPILKSADGVNPLAHFTIVSYDLLSRDGIYDALVRGTYDLLILDEGHYLKTVDTRRTRAVFGGLRSDGTAHLAERAERIVSLTGTPLPNRPRECYTHFRHLCWDAIDWMSEDAFQHRYNPSLKYPSGKIVERQGHLPELRGRLRCNLMVRRLFRAVLPQLPEVTSELTYIEPNGAIRKALKAERLLDIDPAHLEDIDPDLWGHIATVRMEMGVAKVPRVAEHIHTLLTSGLEKVVVICYHRDVISRLADKLEGYGVVVVQGGLGTTRVEARKQQFMTDPKTRVFIGQIQTAGTGLDGLQKVCNRIVFAEASWTPKDNDQAIKRVGERIGQTLPVLAQFLVAPGSLDERILGTAIEKAQHIHQVLDAE